MFYVLRFLHFKCDQIEGFTENEFIFRQYVQMVNYSFRNIEYELLTEDISEEELLAKYKFYKSQRIRSYTSADGSTVIYCNPLFMADWFGARERTWNMTNRSKVPQLMSKFLNATIALYQLLYIINPEKRADFYDPFRKILVYAIQAVEGTEPVLDQVKLIAYINNFPRTN